MISETASRSQLSTVLEVDGVVFVPIPHDPADAYKLYESSPLFKSVIDVMADERHIDALLRSGPTALEIPKERLGLIGA